MGSSSNQPDPDPRQAIERLLNPRSVAVVGASGDPQRTAGKPLKYLREHGYAGQVYAVNPRYQKLQGFICLPSVADLPETPDVGLVVLGPDRAAQAVAELAARDTPAAIVLAGGYAEIDAAGAARQQELKEAAGGMRLLGPNSIGLVNVTSHAALSPSGALEVKPLLAGRVALVSQSGGMLGALLSRAVARGVGLSKLVATGNEADLQIADILDVLVDDPDTQVIALYIEGLRQAERFRRAAGRARSAGKPVVAFKVGRSEAGARSAVSHTGALAGSDRLYSAFFEQLGVTRAESFPALLDIACGLASGRRPAGRRLAVLTSTGGAGVLVADACGLRGFEAPPPDAATVAALSGLVPDEAAVADRNPVDITLAGLRPEVFSAATRALLDSPSYDAVAVVVGASGLANPDLAAGPVIACAGQTSKPLIGYVSPYAPHILDHLNRHGVPAFDTPEGLAAALDAMARVNTGAGGRNSQQEDGWPPAGRRLAPWPAGELHGRLNELETLRLFASFGIPAVRHAVAGSASEAGALAADFAGPVVLKVLSRDIAHKSDAGGVLAGLRGPAEVAAAAEQVLAEVRNLAPQARLEGLLIEEQVSGIELLLGCIHDAQLGPAVMLASGGVLAEVLDDAVFRLPPVSEGDARAMIRLLRSYPLLTGYRGRPQADIEALSRAIVAFSSMLEAAGQWLEEAEINPLFVLPAGQGVRAADALAVLA